MQHPELSEANVHSEHIGDGPTHEGLYPIRTVSALTGVNPVTLRAWERRYGLIKPQRTPKGHRLYTEADVDRIQRILDLLKQGIPIGQTRRLLDSPAAAAPTTPAGGATEDPWQTYRQRLFAAVSRFDDSGLESAYNDALSLYPIDLVTRLLVVPLLHDLRERWQSEPAADAEAHFFNAYMRNKLGARFHHQAQQARGPKLLAAGLPGDSGEIELLLFALTAITHGYRIVLLGANMPLASLPLALERSQSRALVLYGNVPQVEPQLRDELRSLTDACDVPVFVGGETAHHSVDLLKGAGTTVLPTDTTQAMSAIYEGLGG